MHGAPKEVFTSKNQLMLGLAIWQAMQYTVILFRSILQTRAWICCTLIGQFTSKIGTPLHFAKIVRTFLDEQFPARESPYITWSARSDTRTFFGRLKERFYAAVNSVTPQMLHNTWVEVEYRLDIPRATNGSHVEVHGAVTVGAVSCQHLCVSHI